MMWTRWTIILLVGTITCRAEVGQGTVSGQDVTVEDEVSKSSAEHEGTKSSTQDIGNVAKSLLPDLSKLSSADNLPKILTGMPVDRSSGDDEIDFEMNDFQFRDSNIEDGEKVLEEKCRTYGGEAAVESAKIAKENMMECAQSMVNVTQLQVEIDENKGNGELDTVFKKYCRKVPRFQECLLNFTNAIDPCLKEEERVTKTFLHNVTDAMLSFVCYKEGDRIALFIAEGGPDCMAEKQNDVKNCLNKTLAKHLPKQMPEAESLPSLVIEEAQCLEINEMQACIVKSLETCKEPTPANIVESMMNYLKKSSPCAKYLVVNSSPNLISTLAQTLLSSLVVLLLLAFK